MCNKIRGNDIKEEEGVRGGKHEEKERIDNERGEK